MQTTPFKRSLQMMAEIQAIISSTPASLQKFALESLGQYKSHGKGKGLMGRNFLRPYQTNWKQRHAGRVQGVDYGKRECKRRIRQQLKK